MNFSLIKTRVKISPLFSRIYSVPLSGRDSPEFTVSHFLVENKPEFTVFHLLVGIHLRGFFLSSPLVYYNLEEKQRDIYKKL